MLQLLPLSTGNMLSFTPPAASLAWGAHESSFLANSPTVSPSLLTYELYGTCSKAMGTHPYLTKDKTLLVSLTRYRASLDLLGGGIEVLRLRSRTTRTDFTHDKSPITTYHSLGHMLLWNLDALILPFSQLNPNSKTGGYPNDLSGFDFIDHAQEQQLSIISILRVGEESLVSCIVCLGSSHPDPEWCTCRRGDDGHTGIWWDLGKDSRANLARKRGWPECEVYC